jgi:hypothetical protein
MTSISSRLDFERCFASSLPGDEGFRSAVLIATSANNSTHAR